MFLRRGVSTGRARSGTAFLLAGVALAGCSSAPGGAVVRTLRPAPTVADCPAPPATTPSWPGAVPASLPKPPGATITGTQTLGSVTYVDFTSPVSLRQGTLFVVDALRAAGYVLGRGDAEPTEADAPFSGTTIVGALRLTLTAACLTTWKLAVEPRDGPPEPLPSLVPYRPGPQASPLPFG